MARPSAAAIKCQTSQDTAGLQGRSAHRTATLTKQMQSSPCQVARRGCFADSGCCGPGQFDSHGPRLLMEHCKLACTSSKTLSIYHCAIATVQVTDCCTGRGQLLKYWDCNCKSLMTGAHNCNTNSVFTAVLAQTITCNAAVPTIRSLAQHTIPRHHSYPQNTHT